MKKSLAMFLSATLIVVIAVSSFFAYRDFSDSTQSTRGKPFYLGVTYCGNSTAEADQLIDKVKGYTNLFVVQSGPLEEDFPAMEQILDYAVHAGLNVIAYYGGSASASNITTLLGVAQARWGSHFLGVYYSDEPGGKMLDSDIDLGDISKSANEVVTTTLTGTSQTETIFQFNGAIDVLSVNYTGQSIRQVTLQLNVTVYLPNGTIIHQTGDMPLNNGTFTEIGDFLTNGTLIDLPSFETLTYQSDGTVQDQNGTDVTDRGGISQFMPYLQLWNSRPLQTYDQAAATFVDAQQTYTGWLHNQSSVTVFTSDYGLYWFDYLGGYGVVLAELCGNQTDAQALALVRGAADMQGKSWGVMLTWQTSTAPYLSTGNEMYNEMLSAYQEGATYVAVFNYSPNGDGVGLLQPEQFSALQRFWTNVVQSHKVVRVEAEDVLVLPTNYGWGMRRPDDTIWGLWQADNNSAQVWVALQSAMARDGAKLDVVYDSAAYPTAGRYEQIIYWNQTM